MGKTKPKGPEKMEVPELPRVLEPRSRMAEIRARIEAAGPAGVELTFASNRDKRSVQAGLINHYKRQGKQCRTSGGGTVMRVWLEPAA